MPCYNSGNSGYGILPGLYREIANEGGPVMDQYLPLAAGGLSLFDASLVSTSLVLVFGLLIALCLIITLEGKVFDSFNDKNNAKKRAKAMEELHSSKPSAPSAPAAHAASAPAAPAPSPAVEAGIPGEVVAAISAAIFSLEGGNAVVREIRRVPQSGGSRRGAWGDAGVIQATRPFL